MNEIIEKIIRAWGIKPKIKLKLIWALNQGADQDKILDLVEKARNTEAEAFAAQLNIEEFLKGPHLG